MGETERLEQLGAWVVDVAGFFLGNAVGALRGVGRCHGRPAHACAPLGLASYPGGGAGGIGTGLEDALALRVGGLVVADSAAHPAPSA